MADRPSIWVRKFVKWGVSVSHHPSDSSSFHFLTHKQDDPGFEDTQYVLITSLPTFVAIQFATNSLPINTYFLNSTLLLITPAKHFIDVRIYLDPDDAYRGWEDCVHEEERLQFAFAGTSISAEGDGDHPARVTTTIWTHWVDFDETEADSVKRESKIFRQPSGNMLEMGTMKHPDTGKKEEFVHAWEKFSIDEGPKIGWVWNVEGKEEGIRGLFIRIGSVAQGVYRHGEEIRVGRTTGIGVAEGDWDVPQFSIGKGDVSLTELFFDEAQLGQNFVGKFGEIWQCVESFTWT